MPRELYDVQFGEMNKNFKNLLGDSYIEVYLDLCDDEFCYHGKDNEIFFSDSNHLSENSLHHLVSSKRLLSNLLKNE